MTRYQKNYSKLYPAEFVDESSRLLKAKKVLAVLRDRYHGRLSGLSVLEVGCSSGGFSLVLNRHFRSYKAVDIDSNAIRLARAKTPGLKSMFSVMNAEKLGFPERSFDVVICTHIYEHVPRPERMMACIRRVLKDGGTCYFAAGNRWNIVEPHYKIPFLSIMPKAMASLLLRMLRKTDRYYETHFGLGGLRRLVRDFRIVDYTARIVDDPVRFSALDMFRPGGLKHLLARFAVRFLYGLMPTYIWLLEKPAGK